MATHGQVRIGISGWRYPRWRGVFYPGDLPQRRELEYVATTFPTVEINGTFYSLQRPSSFAAWHDATPEGFVFAVKGPRFITHHLRLRGVERALSNFLASGVLALGTKLGPFLWQLPPNFRFEAERIDAFLASLPRDTDAAAALARRRDRTRMAGRSRLVSPARVPLRHALEVRHESFRDPKFIEILRRHEVALVVADTAGKWPLLEDLTAPFAYVRLHGDIELYASGYGDAALERWSQRIDAWRRGREPVDARRVLGPARGRAARDVYVYFDNDVKVHAPFDALCLAQKLGVAAEGSGDARARRRAGRRAAARTGAASEVPRTTPPWARRA